MIPIEATRKIVFARDPDTLEDAYEAEDTDLVDAVETVEIAQLVEDELLLSMPFSPRHEAGACSAAVRAEELGKVEARPSPFSVLAQLTRKTDRN